MAESSIVTTNNLTFAFTQTRRALQSVSFEVEHGSIAVIMGPSGCGKTTLLRLIAGCLVPTAGDLTVQTDKIAFLYQQDGLLPWYTVRQNVALPRLLARASRGPISEIPLSALDSVGLRSAMDLFPHELSVGMRKRAELARVFASQGDLWLLDEPFESLDPPSRLLMTKLVIDERRKKGASVIVVTHGFDDALLLADCLHILSSEGKFVESLKLDSPHPRDITSMEFQLVRRRLLSLFSTESGSKNNSAVRR